MLNQIIHYMIASIVSAVIGLLSAIVFTRLLSPEEYGVYVIGLSTAGIVSAMLFTWVRISALRFQSAGASADVRVTLLAGYLISVLGAPFALLMAILFTSVSLERSLAAVGFALGLGLFELGQELLKAKLQSFAFMFASIVRACVAFLLCLVAALLGGGGLGQLIMVTITYLITSLLFAPAIWRRPVARFDISDLRTFATFGIPVTISGIIFALHAALDRMMVFHLMGDTAAGHYGATADLVRQIILIPATSVASATIPHAARAFADGGTDEARRQLEQGFEILIAMVFPAVAGLAVSSQYVSAAVLGADFRATAIQIMPILAFAWLFQTLTQSYVHAAFHLAKRPALATLQGAVMLLVSCLTMPLLIVKFGLTGAAFGLVVVEAIGTGVGWYLSRRVLPLPLNTLHILRVGAATAIMTFAVSLLKSRLPVSISSLCLLVACGALTYLAAAFLFDVVGLRSRVARVSGRPGGLWPSTRKTEATGRIVTAQPVSSASMGEG
jgi:O-antigen/teichoic acid export membrane protein